MARTSFDPYEHSDHRALLRAFYEHKKAQGRGFSYRVFSRLAGLRSPNHLKRVIDGERDLTPEMAARYARACGFDGETTTYFCDLVALHQAKTTERANEAYERLVRHRRYRSARRLELAHAEYHSRWYLPAIREMSLRSDFRGEPAWIAKRLIPPIGVAEATRAIRVLLDLGMLIRRGKKLVHGESILSTGAEVRGLHIANFHRSMLERASGAIDLVPSERRDISSITMCLPADRLAQLKARIQAFRREIVGEAAAFTEGDEVVQLNIQLFPLTTRRGDE